MKKLTKFGTIAVVLAILAISIASVTLAATFLSGTQAGSQDIKNAPTPTPSPTASPTPSPTAPPNPSVNAPAFYLPPGTVGLAEGSYASTTPLSAPIYSPPANPVLTVTTDKSTQQYLKITSPNSAGLSVNYGSLVLYLYAHTDDGNTPSLGQMDLLSSSSSILYALPLAPGTSSFDYIIHYTPSAAGTAVPINLAYAISDTP